MKVVVALALVASVASAEPGAPSGPPGETVPAAIEPARITPDPPHLERVDPPANARTAAWIATGVTAAIVGIGVFSVVRMRQESSRANELFGMADHWNEWHDAVVSNDRWFHATLVFGGLTVVSAAVTGVLWSRAQPSYRVAVTPQGAFVGYARSF